MRIEAELALEFFLWGVEVFSRRDCGWILAGYTATEGEQRIERVLERLRRQKLLEQTGRGRNAKFTITDRGRQRLRVRQPSAQWDQPWDGQWRAFLFDLPAGRAKERQILWRALRRVKMGLLQRSVWIWPHEVAPYLQTVVQGHNLPDCFCGFRAASLFLCDHADVVRTAWDFPAIRRAHDIYRQHLVANIASLNRARDLQALADVARVERAAYADAFARDPLLPRELWPKAYQGPQVEDHHQTFQARLRSRLRELAAP